MQRNLKAMIEDLKKTKENEANQNQKAAIIKQR